MGLEPLPDGQLSVSYLTDRILRLRLWVRMVEQQVMLSVSYLTDRILRLVLVILFILVLPPFSILSNGSNIATTYLYVATDN